VEIFGALINVAVGTRGKKDSSARRAWRKIQVKEKKDEEERTLLKAAITMTVVNFLSTREDQPYQKKTRKGKAS